MAASQVVPNSAKAAVVAWLNSKTLYIGWGKDSTAASGADTGLKQELTTADLPGYARQAATKALATTVFANDTLNATATISGAALTGGATVLLREVALYDDPTAGQCWVRAVFDLNTLSANSAQTDTLSFQEQ